MAHFAKVLNGVVQKVIVADPEFFETFVDDSPGEWIQASYNAHGGLHYNPETNEPDGGEALRKNYPSPGFLYDRDRDAFMPPKPYPSWVLNEFSCLWDAPIPYPDDGKTYIWDESTLSWVQVETVQ